MLHNLINNFGYFFRVMTRLIFTVGLLLGLSVGFIIVLLMIIF